MSDLAQLLDAIIYPIARQYETKAEYWLRGDDTDESLSYCFECGEKEVSRLQAENPTEDLRLVGGYRTEGDSQIFCETCESPLNNSFTDYACESELEHFEGHGFDSWSPDDCHSLANILSGHRIGGTDEVSQRLEALARQIVGQRFRDVMSQAGKSCPAHRGEG